MSAAAAILAILVAAAALAALLAFARGWSSAALAVAAVAGALAAGAAALGAFEATALLLGLAGLAPVLMLAVGPPGAEPRAKQPLWAGIGLAAAGAAILGAFVFDGRASPPGAASETAGAMTPFAAAVALAGWGLVALMQQKDGERDQAAPALEDAQAVQARGFGALSALLLGLVGAALAVNGAGAAGGAFAALALIVRRGVFGAQAPVAPAAALVGAIGLGALATLVSPALPPPAETGAREAGAFIVVAAAGAALYAQISRASAASDA